VNASSAGLGATKWVFVVVAARDGDNENCDCIAVFILSHGRDSGKVYGTDREILVSRLMEPLKKNRILDGKPKMVFVQVCCSN